VTLYTCTGDKGETSLVDGTRLSKSDNRVAAYGDIDELNAILGIALVSGLDSEIADIVIKLQNDLFAVGCHLADPRKKVTERIAKTTLDASSVMRLEGWIDAFDADLPPLRHFLLPGGGIGGAVLHMARAVCRRAERKIVGLGLEAVPPDLLKYVNRLSDLLFVLARAVNDRCDNHEREW